MNEFLNYSLGRITLGMVLSAGLVGIASVVAIHYLMKVVARAVRRIPPESSLRSFVKSSVRLILYFIAILLVCGCLNIPITSLVAVFSVAGLAISLAVQDALTNLVNGLMLLTIRPFAVGDYIEAGDVGGTVDAIQMLHTRLLTPENKVIYLPNSTVAGGKIVNFSKMANRRMEIRVTASYDAPIAAVKAALMKAAARIPLLVQDPAPFCAVNDYKESSVEYILRAWAPVKVYWDAYYPLLEMIKTVFDEDNIEMTYNHLNVHMK